MINVLIVEDNIVNQKFLVHLVESDPELRVAGVASNGEEAVEAVQRLQPDVVTMDLFMPRLDGYEATRRIMDVRATPIIIVSGHHTVKEDASTFRLLEAGAVSIVLRPPGFGHPDHRRSACELTDTIKLMSEVRVVRRSQRHASRTAGIPTWKIGPAGGIVTAYNVVAMGASTGGPLTFQRILSALPRDLPAPVLIVQHIAHGFTRGFVEWLCTTTDFPLQIARQGETAMPGIGYVAPDGHHLGMAPGNRLKLHTGACINGSRPSVSYLFRSVAETCGPNTIGVLLTGMGRDGADELRLLRDVGALTIAQDKVSSVVHGMPGEAIKLNAAKYILAPDTIATVIASSLMRTPSHWK